jgi:signal transduction histidine kinase
MLHRLAPLARISDSVRQEDALRVSERLLPIATIIWSIVALLALGLVIVGQLASYRQILVLSPSALPDGWTAEAMQASLAALGVPASLYAIYKVALNSLLVLAYFAVAATIIWRRPATWIAVFVAFFLVLFPTNWVTEANTLPSAWSAPLRVVDALAWTSFLLFFFLFPDGRFVPRWTLRVAIVWTVASALSLALAAWFASAAPFVTIPAWLGMLGCAGYAQISRYRHASNPLQRQQTRWVALGFGAAFLSLVGLLLVGALFSLSQPGQTGLLYQVVGHALSTVLFLAIPLSIAVALLRYHLWDLDLVVNRTLVYGALTASVIGGYALVVGALGGALQARGNLLISLLATGLVALLFQPLRQRVQRGVNRLMYGERDEPYTVITRLGQRLEASLPPETLSSTLVESVAHALKLPGVSLWLVDDAIHLRLVATHGEKRLERGLGRVMVDDSAAMVALRHAATDQHLAQFSDTGVFQDALRALGAELTLPLVHQGEVVGALSLAPRRAGEVFSGADLRLLRGLASQAGVAIHAHRLTLALHASLEELRQSRERLIMAQEAERQRVQRDLHDGLGPTLASMRMRLEACLDRAQEIAPDLTADLERVDEMVGQATADIRRLVYALRPPVLDQIGLVPALRQHIAQFTRETGIVVRFTAETPLSMPAAAEVAIFRIVQEALLNVQKHAHAALVEVIFLQRAGEVTLDLCDDGVGLRAEGNGAGITRASATDAPQEGTGLRSMRERADLLGGRLSVEDQRDAGVRVALRIPIHLGEK